MTICKKKNNTSSISSIIKNDLQKIVPKFCTGIQTSVTNENNIILSFVYSEDDEDGKNISSSLISRIVITKESLENFLQILKNTNTDINKKLTNRSQTRLKAIFKNKIGLCS